MAGASEIPRITRGRAVRIAAELFGLEAFARDLPSYSDRNVHLTDRLGVEYVLKIANANVARSVLEAENAVLAHLSRQRSEVAVPKVIATPGGDVLTHIEVHGRPHYVRLVSVVPGKPLALHSPCPEDVITTVGAGLADLDLALTGFDHPGARRRLRWDLACASDLERYLGDIADPRRRARVASHLQRFAERVKPVLRALRRQIIHNDANPHNILVSGESSPYAIGFVDFGDLVHSATVCDLAIAAAYVMLDREDPLEAVLPLLRGYHDRNPLVPHELAILPDLIAIRLCITVTVAAHEKARQPENRYVTVDEAPAWRLLAALSRMGRSRVARFFERRL